MLEEEKQNLILHDELNELREITEETGNVYAAAMLRQEEREQTLRESRFVALGITHKDGAEMQQVKEWQRQIGLAMKGNIRLDDIEFRGGLWDMQEKYAKLIEACEAYIHRHQRPHTASGKERLRLVTATLRMAQQEKEQLEPKAVNLHKVAVKWGKGTLVWGNVLGMIRGMEINMDQTDGVETLDGGTSQLKKIRMKQREYYFKEAESLKMPKEGLQEYCWKSGTNKNERMIYQNINELIQQQEALLREYLNEMEVYILQGRAKEMIQDISGRIAETLLDNGVRTALALDDARTQEILLDVILQYNKLNTRDQVTRIAGISEGEDLSKRNVLTSRMAAIMKLPHLVALSNQAVLRRGDQEQTGIVMAQAVGIQAKQLYDMSRDENKPFLYTPEMIRQTANLQVFDLICGQVDRHYGNRFYTYEEQDGKYIITGVQGIDNDMSFGTLDCESMEYSAQEMKRFARDGICLLPALDKELKETLFALEKETLIYCLRDLLEDKYIDAMWTRIEYIKQVIEKTEKNNKDFLVENWNREVAERFAAGDTFYFYIADLKNNEIA